MQENRKRRRNCYVGEGMDGARSKGKERKA